MDKNELLHNSSLDDSLDKKEIYNQWADTYDDYVNNLNYLGPKNVSVIFQNYVLSSNHSNLKILDFGCGTGLLGFEIHQKLSGFLSFTLDGIDISERMIQKCRERNIYNQIYEINLLQDELPKNIIYDYIVSSGVFLEGHVSLRVINTLLNNLKLNGIIFFTIRESFKNEKINEYQEFILQNSRIEILSETNIDYLPEVTSKLLIVKKLY